MAATDEAPLSVTLCDTNPKVVAAWRAAFADTPEVKIALGSILDQDVDAWVTPTNARGSMDGGVDAVIKRHLGPAIQVRVQRAIKERFGGSMPLGAATCVPSGAARPVWLISTPTMAGSSEDVSDTHNVALACAAAFQAVHRHNRTNPDAPIRSVALPGLGANTGRVPPRVCANLMWAGYALFLDHPFADDASLRETVLNQLGGAAEANDDTRIRFHAPGQP